MPRIATLKTWAMNQFPGPLLGGSLVNQITRNWPLTELLIRKVTLPLAPLAEATVVIELRFAWLRSSELPTSSLTLLPGGTVPKVTTTDRNVTGLAISIKSPAPAFKPPNSGDLYHCEAQKERGDLSVALGAFLEFSLSPSPGLSGSKPVAFTGGRVVIDDVTGVVGRLEAWLPACGFGPLLGQKVTVATTATRTSAPAAARIPTGILVAPISGSDRWARRP